MVIKGTSEAGNVKYGIDEKGMNRRFCERKKQWCHIMNDVEVRLQIALGEIGLQVSPRAEQMRHKGILKLSRKR